MTELSEQSRKRAENRHAILRSLQLVGPQQRAALSRTLGIRKTSVTNITAEAIRHGLVAEDDPKSLRTTLSLCTKKACVAVARLGTSEVESARVLFDGTVEGAKAFAFPPGADTGLILDAAERALRHQLKAGGRKVLGVGFADIGVVDPEAGITRFASNLDQWRDVPVRAELEKRLGIGVYVDSDVRSQLWASAWFDRHLRDASTMLYIGLMEGVAGALMLDGRMVWGRSFTAGEFGHVRAGSEGRACGCGKLDCLETYCSLPAITREIRKLRPRFDRTDESGAAIARLSDEDEGIRKLLRGLAIKIAGVVAPILVALDPDALVFGSPASSFAGLMGKLVHAELQRELAGLGAGQTRLILTGADHRSTLRGIGGLVIERCFRFGTPALATITS